MLYNERKVKEKRFITNFAGVQTLGFDIVFRTLMSCKGHRYKVWISFQLLFFFFFKYNPFFSVSICENCFISVNVYYLFLQKCEKVIGLAEDGVSYSDCLANAAANRIENCRFHKGAVQTTMPHLFTSINPSLFDLTVPHIVTIVQPPVLKGKGLSNLTIRITLLL